MSAILASDNSAVDATYQPSDPNSLGAAIDTAVAHPDYSTIKAAVCSTNDATFVATINASN